MNFKEFDLHGIESRNLEQQLPIKEAEIEKVKRNVYKLALLW